MKLQWSVMAAVAMLTACTMEPHYERPAAPVPVTWTDKDQPSNNATPATQMGWRDFFPDKNMQRLIEIALANNRDLRVAALNVQATQAQYRIQRSDLFPRHRAPGALAEISPPARAPAARRSASSRQALDLLPTSSTSSAGSAVSATRRMKLI
jgi:outer membrane protein, multidrug efflux system